MTNDMMRISVCCDGACPVSAPMRKDICITKAASRLSRIKGSRTVMSRNHSVPAFTISGLCFSRNVVAEKKITNTGICAKIGAKERLMEAPYLC